MATARNSNSDRGLEKRSQRKSRVLFAEKKNVAAYMYWGSPSAGAVLSTVHMLVYSSYSLTSPSRTIITSLILIFQVNYIL